MSAPASCIALAPIATVSGSPPKTCTETGRSSSVQSIIVFGAGVAELDRVRAEHLGGHQPAPTRALAHHPERVVGHPRHRGEDERRIDGDVADIGAYVNMGAYEFATYDLQVLS